MNSSAKNRYKKYKKQLAKYIIKNDENFDYDYFLRLIDKKLTLMGKCIFEDDILLEKKKIVHTIWYARYLLRKINDDFLEKRINFMNKVVYNKFGFYLKDKINIISDKICSHNCNSCLYKEICDTDRLLIFYYAVDKEGNPIEVENDRMLKVYDFYENIVEKFISKYEEDSNRYLIKFFDYVKENIYSWWD